METFEPDKLPVDLAAIPAVKPGNAWDHPRAEAVQ
jgi:hypothetical protein